MIAREVSIHFNCFVHFKGHKLLCKHGDLVIFAVPTEYTIEIYTGSIY